MNQDGEGQSVVRRERPGDTADVHRVVAAAFGQEDEATLVEALRGDPCWLPDFSLVALAAAPDPVGVPPAARAGNPPGGPPSPGADSTVIGHVLLTRLHVGGAPALALAPLAVDPDWHGRGVGTMLVRAALTRASAAGERLVVVLGDPEYYRRFGFRPAADLGISGPYDLAGPAFQALALPGPPDGGGGPAPMGWASYPAPFGAPAGPPDPLADAPAPVPDTRLGAPAPRDRPPVRIRPAEVGDAAGIAAVLRAVGWFSALAGMTEEELVATVGRQLEQVVGTGTTTTLVGQTAGGTLVGYAQVHWLHDLFLPAPEGYLSELFLVPAVRGHGLGGRFLDEIAAMARARGAFRLMLINGRHRESYQRGFYTKHGWEERDAMANFVYWLDEHPRA